MINLGNEKITFENSLAAKFPVIAAEWHPTKNGTLIPSEIAPQSSKKVWWLCKNGHEWESRIQARHHYFTRYNGTGCPYCSNKLVSDTNNLAVKYPNLVPEWHPTLNKNVKPTDVLPGTHKKAWWKCDRGHEWETAIYIRTSGSGCPVCASGRQTSFPEQTILFYIKQIFNDAQTTYQFKDIRYDSGRKLSVDIFIFSLMLAIEYDGEYAHKQISKIKRDEEKNFKLFSNDISLIRIREPELPILAEQQGVRTIVRSDNFSLESLRKCILDTLQSIVDNYPLDSSQTLIANKLFGLDIKNDYDEIIKLIIRNAEKNSVGEINPHLVSEWNWLKNGEITPFNISYGSGLKVWWSCKEGHEWKASINDRNRGNGCPYCSGQLICADNCLATKKPKLAKQWHPTKNNELTPYDVMPGSQKSVWWQCEKGHEWKANIIQRVHGSGCRKCNSEKPPALEESLLLTEPSIAAEWHPTKNGALTPKDVARQSNRKVWWKCVKNHEWETTVNHRTNGRKCPFCLGRKPSNEHSLSSQYPNLALEWHPSKNGDLTPDNVTPKSHKKVWWLCRKGHEFQTTVYRASGTNCPYCCGQKATTDNCVATLFPQLLDEWDYTKNINISPEDVTPSSNKKVWWKCKSKGHLWQATVHHRVLGTGCPACAGKMVTIDNCLATINPTLSSEWHNNKNGTLIPGDVTPYSNKKVWWLCSKGHEYEASISNRSRGNSCPFCSSHRASPENNLAVINPDVAGEWDYSKNSPLIPYDFLPQSNKKVWWRCKFGHEWSAIISHRSRGLKKCPECKSKKKNV